MRVVAGSARGRRLGPVPPGARPVADRAREGLFSSLGSLVEEARVLDLFAGTGALGIEALSRGASAATFVDSSAAAVAAIRDNLDRTGLGDRASVLRRDALGFLEGGGTFDLVLADPPYDTAPGTVDALVAAVAGLLEGRDARFVLTRPLKGYTPVIPVNLLAARELRYGETLVLVYQQES
ncbi:MAG: RsmD family RNA methyltransferase [Actinomycetota bacterium]